VNIKQTAVVVTATLVLLGQVENTAIIFGTLHDITDDHGVPRVPLAVAAGSGAVATTSISVISATFTHTANFVTGDEYRIPSRDPRPQSQIQDNRRDERGRHGKIILSKPG
jgi:hypothetical protein